MSRRNVALGLCGIWLTTACGIPRATYDAERGRADRLRTQIGSLMQRITVSERLHEQALRKTSRAQDVSEKLLRRLSTDLQKVKARLAESTRQLGYVRDDRRREAEQQRVRSARYQKGEQCSSGLSTSLELHPGLLVMAGERDDRVGDESGDALLESDVRQRVAARLPQMARCLWSQTAKRNRKARGAFSVAFEITRKGRVRGVRTVHRLPRPSAAERCVAKELRRLAFPKPMGTLGLALPFVYDTQPVWCGVYDGSGLDRATILRVIRRHLAETRFCFATHKAPAARLRTGIVRVSFAISPAGRVATVRIPKTTLRHAPTERCIVAAVKRWRFPKPEGSMPYVSWDFRYDQRK